MKKKGLFWKNKIPSSLNDILSEEGFVVSQDSSEQDNFKFRFGANSSSNIFTSEVKWDLVKDSPSAFINTEVLEWDIPKLILKRFFLGEGAINPEDNYQGIVKKSASLKLTNDLSFGQAADQVAFFARANQSNPIQIRNYVVSVLSYLEYLKKSEIVSFPIDLDFGISNDCFFLQVNCHSEGLFIENLIESTQEKSIKSPFLSVLSESLDKTDLLEIYSLSSSQKLVLSACWVSNPNYMRQNSFPTLLIHQIQKFSNSGKSLSKGVVPSIQQDDLVSSEKKYRVAEAIPAKLTSGNSRVPKINPILIKRVAMFIFRNSGESFDNAAYDANQLGKDLSNFYDQDALSSILEEEKAEIIRLIVEGEGYEAIEEQSQAVKGSIDSDEYLKNIIGSMDSLSLEEVRISAGLETLNEDQLIKGEGEEDENSTIVKGVSDEKEESVTIKGVTDNISDDVWKVKRGQVVEKVKGKINDLRNSNLSNSEIDAEIQSIVVGELGIGEEEGARLVESLSDDVTDDYVRGGLELANREIKQRIQIEKMDKQLVARGTQVQKMKSVISGLQGEIRSLREKDSSVVEGSENFHVLNRDFVEGDLESHAINEEKIEEIENSREKEKLTKEIEKLNKDNGILLRKFKENLTVQSEDSEEVNGLKLENENLRSQIEGLKKKVSFMYENSKTSKEIAIEASEVQKIIEDKERYFSEKMKLKKDLEDLKMENRGLEKQIKDSEMKRRSSTAVASLDNSLPDKGQLEAKEKECEELKMKIKKIEADRKSSVLKSKSFEQKVKFLNAQLENLQKQESRNKGKRAPGAIDAKVADRLKQMEVISSRLKTTNDKLSKELSEKKTIAHKASLEAKTMGLKIKDLERKLAVLNKKKAA